MEYLNGCENRKLFEIMSWIDKQKEHLLKSSINYGQTFNLWPTVEELNKAIRKPFISAFRQRLIKTLGSFYLPSTYANGHILRWFKFSVHFTVHSFTRGIATDIPTGKCTQNTSGKDRTEGNRHLPMVQYHHSNNKAEPKLLCIYLK